MHPDRPSWTARSVANSLLLLEEDEVFGHLIDSQTALLSRWLLEFKPSGGPARTGATMVWTRELQILLESWFIPGLSCHIVARKRWIERETRKRLDPVRGQLIVLGAGFDTLAWRVSRENPRIKAWEIDHPATQRAKREALNAHPEPIGQLSLVAADLVEPGLADTLRRQDGWDPSRPTVIIAEGLLMYLEAESAHRVLQLPRNLDLEQYSILGSMLEPDSRGRLRLGGSSPVIGWSLTRAQEPFRYALPPDRLTALLQRLGSPDIGTFSVRDVLADLLLDTSDIPTFLPSGEYLFRADADVAEKQRKP